MTAALKFENISETTADISLSSVPRIRIKEGTVELNKAAGNDAADLSIATMKDVRSNQRMFEIIAHNGPLETIPVGTLPANGQKFYAALYPEAAEALESGHQFIVSELLWSTGVVGNPDAYKGCFSLGGEDENGRWYRMPKLNADSSTGYRAPFLRGSEIGVDAGVLTDDRIRNIQGKVLTTVTDTGMIEGVGENGPSGPFSAVSGATGYATPPRAGTAPYPRSIDFDASLVVPTGPENSPRYHGVIMCIRMFGAVSNPGSVDAAQLATDLAIANAKIAELENDTGYTVLYPNGGSEASPANVAINSRYALVNPFTGHNIDCRAEVFYNSQWVDVKWDGTNTVAGGVVATHVMPDDIISVQTGATHTILTGSQTGGGQGATVPITTPVPCRVKVWKKKGAA